MRSIVTTGPPVQRDVSGAFLAPVPNERTAAAALDAHLRKQRFVWKLHGNPVDPASIVLGNSLLRPPHAQ
ncbi:MAG: hypothetical protein ACRDLS_13925 [Solirubrobacteraceae bacterium]